MAQPQVSLALDEFTERTERRDAYAEFWTVSQYLEFQRESESKHEYVDGEIYAMAGGSKNHNRIAGDFAALLNTKLPADGKCEAFVGDVLLEVRSTLFYYPDVFVTCDKADDEDEYIARNPVLVTEVLSKSTKRIDRKEKMGEYKKLSNLRECLLIHQDRIAIEHYYRDASDAEWEQRLHTNLQDEITFASIGVTVKAAEIYRRVFAAPPEKKEAESE